MSTGASARAAAPGRPIRVLHLEDQDDDVRLVMRELERGGFAPSVRVEDTPEGLRAALGAEPFDLVLSDYRMPSFDAPAALAIARALAPDVPFIVVSGSVGEEEGVEVMRGGAADYFPKTSLTRLPAAVARELETARRRRAERRELRDRDFLVRAVEVLTASLDFERTLARLAQLAVSAVADWCAVYAREPAGVEGPGADGEGGAAGALRLVALASADPDAPDDAGAFRRRYALDPDGAPSGDVLEVLRSGQGRLRRAWEDSPGARALGLTSALYVPLTHAQGAFGVLVFATAGRTPPLGEEDLSLGEELGRRASLALENARLYREAQAAVRARDEFLQMAAHELRTPVTALKLQLASLAARARPEDAPALERSTRQVQRLSALVEAMLQAGLQQGGAMPVLPSTVFDLGSVVAEALGRIEPQARAAGCALQVQDPAGVTVEADRGRLGQVLDALLGNAVKFGPGAPVEVELREADGRARVCISDRGIGVAPEARERIFERFGRAVSSRRYGGLGLGLHLARRVVEGHGGRLWVEAREGGGSRFVLELPMVGAEGA